MLPIHLSCLKDPFHYVLMNCFKDPHLTLLQELKKCFDAQDVPMLQATIAKMPEQEAIYYMKRCVDSGLWVPGNNDEEPTMKENAAPEKKDAPSASTDDLD